MNLTNPQTAKIKRNKAIGFTVEAIAAEMGLTVATVRQVLYGEDAKEQPQRDNQEHLTRVVRQMWKNNEDNTCPRERAKRRKCLLANFSDVDWWGDGKWRHEDGR